MFDLEGILAMLNGEEYPETFSYLSSIDENTDAYEIASTMINLDQPDDFPCGALGGWHRLHGYERHHLPFRHTEQ